MFEDCIACGMFQTLDALSLSFAREAFDATSGTVAKWLTGFMVVWGIFFFVRLMLRGKATALEFGTKLVLFLLATVFLNTGALWMEWVVFPLRDAATGMAVRIAALSGETTTTGFPGMIADIEREVLAVRNISQVAMTEAGVFGTVEIAIGSLFLILPFFAAWFLFVGFLLEAIFKFMAITAIAPFVIGSLLFEVTKSFGRDSIRIFVSGLTGILFMAVAMGFTIAIIREYVGVLPNPPGLEDLRGFYWSDGYFAMILIGCLSVLFHIIARQMATSVAGVMDSQIASQAMMGMGGFAAAKAISGSQAAGRKAGQGINRGARAAGNAIASRMGWGGPAASGRA